MDTSAISRRHGFPLILSDGRCRIAFLLYFILFCVTPVVHGQVDSGYVKIEDGKLYYEIYGKGEPLLFVNSGPAFSSRAFRRIALGIDSTAQVILFDQRGTGKSNLNIISGGTIRIDKMVEDIEQLRDHLGIEKWNVVGLGFGSYYALSYAAEHKDRIRKLVLASPILADDKTCPIRQVTYPKREEMTAVELDLLDTIQHFTNDTHADAHQLVKYRMAMNSRFYIYDVKNLRREMNWFAHEIDFNLLTFVYSTRLLQEINLKKKFKKATFETLILYCSSDFITFQVPQRLDEEIPNSELVVFDYCGHAMWREKERAFNLTIRKFLKGND